MNFKDSNIMEPLLDRELKANNSINFSPGGSQRTTMQNERAVHPNDDVEHLDEI